jgi:hypothetical protein
MVEHIAGLPNLILILANDVPVVSVFYRLPTEGYAQGGKFR